MLYYRSTTERSVSKLFFQYLSVTPTCLGAGNHRALGLKNQFFEWYHQWYVFVVVCLVCALLCFDVWISAFRAGVDCFASLVDMVLEVALGNKMRILKCYWYVLIRWAKVAKFYHELNLGYYQPRKIAHKRVLKSIPTEQLFPLNGSYRPSNQPVIFNNLPIKLVCNCSKVPITDRMPHIHERIFA